MKLVAFTGLKGSGKDTAARAFTDAGFAHVKMAGALKQMLRTLLDYQGVPPDQVERMIDGDEKELDSFLLGGRSPRHAMQTLGTEWGRQQMADDFWIQMTRTRIQNLGQDVVISDIRFPNEVAMVKALGGEVWRIVRPGTIPGDPHPSEVEIMNLTVDGVFRNFEDTAEGFTALIRNRFALADYVPRNTPPPANDRDTAEKILGYFRSH